MSKQLPLTRGLFALVDDDAFDELSKYSWFAAKGGKKFYAYCSIGGRAVSLHRYLMGCPKQREVDHISGDTLDNRRDNLRLCSHQENIQNKLKQPDTSSRFKGVYLGRASWTAKIEQNGEQLRLGSFTSEFAAARQYDRAARIFFGAFAKTNADLGLFEGVNDRVLERRKAGRPRKVAA